MESINTSRWNDLFMFSHHHVFTNDITHISSVSTGSKQPKRYKECFLRFTENVFSDQEREFMNFHWCMERADKKSLFSPRSTPVLITFNVQLSKPFSPERNLVPRAFLRRCEGEPLKTPASTNQVIFKHPEILFWVKNLEQSSRTWSRHFPRYTSNVSRSNSITTSIEKAEQISLHPTFLGVQMSCDEPMPGSARLFLGWEKPWEPGCPERLICHANNIPKITIYNHVILSSIPSAQLATKG